MVAYSFQARFAPPIIVGTKRQTIRGGRKRHAKQGEELQLFTGMRTRQCRLIGRARCITVQRVIIAIRADAVHFPLLLVTLTDLADLDRFAQRDGFSDWRDMCAWWSLAHPGVAEFDGFLIDWGETFSPAPVR